MNEKITFQRTSTDNKTASAVLISAFSGFLSNYVDIQEDEVDYTITLHFHRNKTNLGYNTLNMEATIQKVDCPEEDSGELSEANPALPLIPHFIEKAASRIGLQKFRFGSNGREYRGPNPFDIGATEDGFILWSNGYAYDRKLQKRYSWQQVRKLLKDIWGIEYNGETNQPEVKDGEIGKNASLHAETLDQIQSQQDISLCHPAEEVR